MISKKKIKEEHPEIFFVSFNRNRKAQRRRHNFRNLSRQLRSLQKGVQNLSADAYQKHQSPWQASTLADNAGDFHYCAR